MRSLVRGTTILLAALLATAASADAQARVDRRMGTERDVSLRIFNLAGSVRIIGWDHDSVAVTLWFIGCVRIREVLPGDRLGEYGG